METNSSPRRIVVRPNRTVADQVRNIARKTSFDADFEPSQDYMAHVKIDAPPQQEQNWKIEVDNEYVPLTSPSQKRDSKRRSSVAMETRALKNVIRRSNTFVGQPNLPNLDDSESSPETSSDQAHDLTTFDAQQLQFSRAHASFHGHKVAIQHSDLINNMRSSTSQQENEKQPEQNVPTLQLPGTKKQHYYNINTFPTARCFAKNVGNNFETQRNNKAVLKSIIRNCKCT